MSNPIDIGNAQRAPMYDPYTGKQLDDAITEAPEALRNPNYGQQFKQAAEPVSPPSFAPQNVHAPTVWAPRKRDEFDITLPSGQVARIFKLEREDLFRMNMLNYLDSFTPAMMEDTISVEERDRRIKQKMKGDSGAIANMFMAIDEVVMFCTARPRVTDNEDLVDYGSPKDWTNPKFIATANIKDITMEDRFAIFAQAFGQSMDDLKSLLRQEAGMAGVADQPGVQSTAE